MTATSSTKVRKPRKRLKEPCEVGWCELVDLPDFGLPKLHAKIDTGARTSSLHAVRIKPFERDGEEWVAFTIPRSPEHAAKRVEARVFDHRPVKSSNGKIQERYVIETTMTLGPLTWAGHITLANRGSMAFPMLVGRRALRRGFLVNSGKRWMLGKPKKRMQKS